MIGDSLIGTTIIDEPPDDGEDLVTDFEFSLEDLEREELSPSLQQRAQDSIARMLQGYYSNDAVQVRTHFILKTFYEV